MLSWLKKGLKLSLFLISPAIILLTGYFLLSPAFRKSGELLPSPIGDSPPELGSGSGRKEIFGFLPYWILKNHEFLRYDLLTTIAYFGLHIDETGEFIKIKDDGNSELGWLNWKRNGDLGEVVQAAKKNNVRVGLTVIAQDNNVVEKFLNCLPCWETLTTNIITELKEKNISDLNLDFEYQGVPEVTLRDKYTDFVRGVSKQIHETIRDSRVSVDTYADAATKTKLPDVKALAEVADALFIMAYDFHRLTDDKTGPIAPLSGAPDKYKYDLTLMLRDYLRFAPKEKLIMGVAYYGYDWLTEDEKLGSSRLPGNDAIGFSRVAYYGTCEYHPGNTGGQKKWDEEAQAPWFYYHDEERGVFRQCHYENRDSLAAKYEFIKKNNLRGVGIWALGYDGSYSELWDLLEEKIVSSPPEKL